MDQKRIDDLVGGWTVDDREWEEFLRARNIKQSLVGQERDLNLIAAVKKGSLSVEDTFADISAKRRILREVLGYKRLNGGGRLELCPDRQIGRAFANAYGQTRKRVDDLNIQFLEYTREKLLKQESISPTSLTTTGPEILRVSRRYELDGCGCAGGRY